MTSPANWEIGQEVVVAPRTWPGINKPGGHGKIVQIHHSSVGIVDSLDVKYTLGGGTDTNLETDLVKPHVELDRGRRSRKARDFFTVEERDLAPKTKSKSKEKKDPQILKTTTDSDKENAKPRLVVPKQKAARRNEQLPDAKAQKKRKTPKASQPEKSAAATVSRESQQNPRKSKNKEKQLVQKEKTNNGIQKQAPRLEDKIKISRSSIPEYIDTSDISVSQTVSPLMDGAGDHSNIASRTLQQISDADSYSFSNNGASVVKHVPAAERKTLKHVYDNQVQDASDYINNLVGASKPVIRQQPPKPEILPYVKQEKTAEQQVDEERGHQFGQLFSSLMQANDSCIEEENLLEAINRSISSSKNDGTAASKLFTEDEAERYVSRLCSQDKIMKSDGYLYGI